MLSKPDARVIADLRKRVDYQHQRALKVIDWLEKHLGKSPQAQDEDAVREYNQAVAEPQEITDADD